MAGGCKTLSRCVLCIAIPSSRIFLQAARFLLQDLNRLSALHVWNAERHDLQPRRQVGGLVPDGGRELAHSPGAGPPGVPVGGGDAVRQLCFRSPCIPVLRSAPFDGLTTDVRQISLLSDSLLESFIEPRICLSRCSTATPPLPYRLQAPLLCAQRWTLDA